MSDSGQVIASAAEVYDEFFLPALFAAWPTQDEESDAASVGRLSLSRIRSTWLSKEPEARAGRVELSVGERERLLAERDEQALVVARFGAPAPRASW